MGGDEGGEIRHGDLLKVEHTRPPDLEDLGGRGGYEQELWPGGEHGVFVFIPLFDIQLNKSRRRFNGERNMETRISMMKLCTRRRYGL
jgi:hypothetical protein